MTGEIQKQYQELTFTDNFMFCKIMEKHPGLCRQMLEIILDVKINRIVSADREEVLGVTPEGKSIRLDVYVEDDKGTVYDIEMQTSDKKNLPKRSRYYQGMIDLNSIEKGADYKELRKTYIIFICTFDLFQKGLPVYTFTNKCTEMMELELCDNTTKVFINADGYSENLTEDMQAFLKLLKGEAPKGNKFAEALQDAVEKAKKCEEWRLEYMTLMMEYRERYNEGKVEGKAEGKAEAILELLEDYGEPSEELRKYIMGQTDLDILKQWHKLAAKAESIEAFEEAVAALPSIRKNIDASAK